MNPKNVSPSIDAFAATKPSFVERTLVIVRYGFSGGTASAIDVGLLYALTHYANWYYLYAAAAAYTCSFFARFFLQKYFTFQAVGTQGLPFEFGSYAVLSGWSVLASFGLLKGFVDGFGWHPVSAQIAVTLLIAAASFFVYRFVIFKGKSGSNE